MEGSTERDGFAEGDWRIRREITINAPVETVWECVGTPELVSQWWCPPPTVDIDFEREEGGDYEGQYRDDDREYDLTGTVVTYDPNRRFAVRRDTRNRFGPADSIDIVLRSEHDRTNVVLEHAFEQLPETRRKEARDFFASGWSWSLRKLRDVATRSEQ